MNKVTSLFYHAASSARSVLDAVQKGWQQAWARGEDLPMHGGGGVRLLNAAKQSAWIFRCLQLIAGPIRSVPLEWRVPGSQEELQDADLAAFWRRPAVTGGGVRLSLGDFIELSCHWIGLKGQALWILDDSWLARGGPKSPIILARADRMTPIQQGDTLLGWRFIDGAGASYNLLPQQVIRPRFLSPYDDAEGLAPLDAAWMAASADHAASVFSRNLAESNGDQGVYVISKGGTLNEEQRTQIVSQLRQKAALARKGDFRAAFLTGDVTIEDPKLRTVDDAFLAGRSFSREEIAAAFGVPPSMLQRMDSYSVGAASDRYRLIDETCVPMGERLISAMQEVESLRSGRDLNAELCWAEHPVMSEVRNEKLKSAAEVWKCGVPWAVLNDTMDLGLDDFPGSDQAWLSMSLEPVQGSAAPSEKTSAAKPDGESDPKKILLRNAKTLDGLVTVLEKMQAVEKGQKAEISGQKSEKEQKRAALWAKHMKARVPSEKLFTAKIRKHLMAARAEVLGKLSSTEKTLGGVRQRGVLDLIFDLSRFTVSLWSDLKKAHTAAMEDATGQFLLEIGRADDPWKMEATQVLNFLGQRENLIRDASRSVHEEILSTLQEGLQKGETTDELAARVRAAFNGVSDQRAPMIATTETAAAYSAVRHAAVQDLEIPFKQWLSAQDDRVRDTHRSIDETTIRADEPFRVPLKDGGEDLMMHPCDANGSAENCINCRCIEIPVMDAPEGE